MTKAPTPTTATTMRKTTTPATALPSPPSAADATSPSSSPSPPPDTIGSPPGGSCDLGCRADCCLVALSFSAANSSSRFERQVPSSCVAKPVRHSQSPWPDSPPSSCTQTWFLPHALRSLTLHTLLTEISSGGVE